MEQLLTLLLTAIGASAMTAAILYLRGLHQRIAALEQDADRRRHTHSTTAGIEDATAVTIDLIIEAEALQARLDTLHRILKATRPGPHSYPVEGVK